MHKFQLVILVFLLLSCNSESSKKSHSTETVANLITINKTGEALFLEYCRECHAKTMINDLTAPPLGGVMKKRGKEWTYSYTRNSQKMHEQGDSIALALRAKNWGLMPAYEELSNADLDSLYAYIEYQYQQNK